VCRSLSSDQTYHPKHVAGDSIANHVIAVFGGDAIDAARERAAHYARACVASRAGREERETVAALAAMALEKKLVPCRA